MVSTCSSVCVCIRAYERACRRKHSLTACRRISSSSNFLKAWFENDSNRGTSAIFTQRSVLTACTVPLYYCTKSYYACVTNPFSTVLGYRYTVFPLKAIYTNFRERFQNIRARQLSRGLPTTGSWRDQWRQSGSSVIDGRRERSRKLEWCWSTFGLPRGPKPSTKTMHLRLRLL